MARIVSVMVGLSVVGMVVIVDGLRGVVRLMAPAPAAVFSKRGP
jgi:hypothetical protein